MKKVCLISLLILSTIPLFSQIVNIEERRITGTNDSTHWYGSIRFGANISKVKDQILSFNGTGQIQHKKDKSLTLLLLDGNFLRAGETDFNKKGFSHLRHNYKITDAIVTEAYIQAQYNKLLLIRLRALTGAGLRFRLFISEDNQHRIYSGLAYLYEKNKFLEELPDQSWHRLSSYISFTFRPAKGVKLVNTTYYQPAFSDFGNYRFATEWRLDTPLGTNLNFFTDFTLSTDQSLPIDAPKTTYAWLNGLAYKF